MTVVIIILLVCAAAGLAVSAVMTVRLFKGFTADETAEGRIKRLKKYRIQIIITYVITVGLITAAAVVKMINR